MANNCTPNVQAWIEDLSRLGRFKAPAGIIEMAASAQNGAEVQAQMIRKDGKNSVYSITYANSTCDTPIDCDSFTCDGAGTDDTTLTTCDTFNSFDCKSMPAWRNLAVSNLRDLGSASTKQVFAAHLWDQMQKIKAAIDVEVVTDVCAAASTNIAPTLSLLNALGAPNFSVDGDIYADFSDNGFAGITPLLVGNRQVLKFAKAQAVAGMNDGGLNLAAMQRFPAFYDNNMVTANCAPTVPTNDTMLATLPGIVNVLSWSENAGMFASRMNPSRWDDVDPLSLIREGDSYAFTTIEDPATGMLFDLNIVFEPKCKKFQYQLKAYYKTLILPVTGCVESGFSGIIKYDICPATAVECAVVPE